MVGQVKHDTLALYTHMLDELLQEAPAKALARVLPDHQQKKPKLLTEMEHFMAGLPLPDVKSASFARGEFGSE